VVRTSRTAARRAVVVATAAVMALGGVMLPGTPVAAAPDQGVVEVPEAEGREWTVTLITGDTVRLTDTGGGRFAAVAEPKRRPDGHLPVFNVRSSPEEVVTIPDDAQAAVDAGILERSLFDVKYLALNGFADDASKQVPLIVQYDGTARRSAFSTAQALPASDATVPLSSVDGAALTVDKQRADQFWNAVRTTASRERTVRPTTLTGGIGKVWLDHKVTATLSESVPLIGAPQAWEAGLDGTGSTVAVLDTGYDAGHPDLAGKVATSKSFIPGEDVADGHGHGTHVAATVAGSGAGSAGKNKGVAPGASLVVGKVLDNGGSGADSSVIAGMEWAARDMDADVVSMSLGAGPTDGTDPLSQAVENLTASTGALFVVAAGNDGPGRETVSAPGAADSALTVAATDKSDGLADFSGRGPRAGDGALKPDISAPGVGIVAARAAGTSLGTPVDDRYTSASGTSMATPHIAGAAAILAQAHPDWTWDRLKAALMSTAKDTGHTVYETGAGRVDVARVISQEVVATTANLDFGISEEGQDTPASKEVTYANSGDTAVTLALTTSLRAENSADSALTAPASVTVPAGGTATVTVTLDPTGLVKGLYSGGVVATDASGVRVTTPVGLNRGVKKFPLTIRTIGFDGGPAPKPPADGMRWEEMSANVTAIDVPGVYFAEGAVYVEPGVLRFMVEEGTYMVANDLVSTDKEGKISHSYLVNPEVEVTGATEITLDARTSVPVTFETPEPMVGGVNARRVVATSRSAWDARYAATHTMGVWSGDTRVTPTRKVTKGDFSFNSQITAHSQNVAMSVVGRHKFDLHPFQLAMSDEGVTFPSEGMPMFPKGTQRRELAYVDKASKEDIAKVNLRGKIAVQRLDPYDTEVSCWVMDDRMRWLKDAGAVGVLLYLDVAHPGCFEFMHEGEDYVVALPFARVTPSEGHRLTSLITRGPVSVQVTGNPDLDYTYQLSEYVSQRVPSSMTYRYGARDLARVDTKLQGSTRTTAEEYWHTWKPKENFSVANGSAFVAPSTRTEYFGGLSEDVLWEGTMDLGDSEPHLWTSFPEATRSTLRWGSTPAAPGAETLPPINTPYWRTACTNCRLGDVFVPLYYNVQGDGIIDSYGGWLNLSSRLFRDGVEIKKSPPAGLPSDWPIFTMPKEEGTYTLTQTHGEISSKWTFRSRTVTEHAAPRYGEYCPPGLYGNGEIDNPCAPQPLVYLGYELGDLQDPRNTVAARGKRTFEVTAYHAQSTRRMPAIAGLKLLYSTDDGKSWRSAKVKKSREHGRFEVTVDLPALAATSGAVSLKAEAWDVSGNRIEQNVNRAFELR
jgi:subtilisin family serine protease